MPESVSAKASEKRSLSGISWFVLLYLTGVAGLSLIAMLLKTLLAGL